MKRPRRSLGGEATPGVSSSTSGHDDTATLLGRTRSENRGRSGGMGGGESSTLSTGTWKLIMRRDDIF